jgi:hypothetical protein
MLSLRLAAQSIAEFGAGQGCRQKFWLTRNSAGTPESETDTLGKKGKTSHFLLSVLLAPTKKEVKTDVCLRLMDHS